MLQENKGLVLMGRNRLHFQHDVSNHSCQHMPYKLVLMDTRVKRISLKLCKVKPSE